MKIRTDFVTNSSSSSFVVINVQSSPLRQFFKDNDIPENFLEILASEIEEPFSWSPDAFQGEYHNLTEALLYFIDFACVIASEDWECEVIKHFPERFYDIGNVSAEKVEMIYNFIHEHSEEINKDVSLVANVMALEIATDGGGEGWYYELRAENGKQRVSALDLWDDVMEPLYDEENEDAVDDMITDIACNDADLWKFAEDHKKIKNVK